MHLITHEFSKSFIFLNINAYSNMSSTEKISIKEGQEFSIKLKSIPLTGYNWHPNYDKNMIDMISNNFDVEGKNNNDTKIGGYGHETFIFKGISEGKTDIKMIYQRDWEKVEVDSRIYMIEIENQN
jgi:predicted secreted protein